MAAAYLNNPVNYIEQRCTKVAQPSRAMAQKAVRMGHRHVHGLLQHGHGILNAYKCPVCRQWHVGHREK